MVEAGSAGAKFWRAIQNHNVVVAEAAAFELKPVGVAVFCPDCAHVKFGYRNDTEDRS